MKLCIEKRHICMYLCGINITELIWIELATAKADRIVSYFTESFCNMSQQNNNNWTTDLSDSAWNNGLWSELLLCFKPPFFTEDSLTYMIQCKQHFINPILKSWQQHFSIIYFFKDRRYQAATYPFDWLLTPFEPFALRDFWRCSSIVNNKLMLPIAEYLKGDAFIILFCML